MKIIIVIVALLFCSIASAEQYTYQSRYNDITPGDGLQEEGSPENPILITDSKGSQVGTIASRYDDFTEGDGLQDPGSPSNPYILDTDE